MKRCSKCSEEQDLKCFSKDKSKKDGLQSKCKSCNKEYQKEHRQKNKENYEKNKKTIKGKKRCLNCGKEKRLDCFYKDKSKKDGLQSCCKDCKKEYYEENRKKIKEKKKEYYEENREKIIENQIFYSKKRREIDPVFRLIGNLRRRLNLVLSGKNKSKSTLDLLGCTVDYLKKHLQKQFQPGMTWDNYGLKGWHIDHIMPCSSFDFLDPKQQKECFNYKNLQPLWEEDNLKKGNKIL